MSLRHRITAGMGAVTLGAVGLFTLPGATGTAAAETCSTAVTPTAAVARALQTTDRSAQQALDFLRSHHVQGSGWTTDGTPGVAEVAATAAAVTALQAAGSTDPSIAVAQQWLASLQIDSGAIDGPGDDRRTTADALPALAGTEAGTRAATWLYNQLTDEDQDGDFDHFETDRQYDYDLTADGVLGWTAAGRTGHDAAAAWLDRHADEYLEEHPGVHALVQLIEVANATGRPADKFGNEELDLISSLADLQDEDGRFGDDIETHAAAINALGADVDALDAATDGNADAVLSAAADVLQSQACTGGGYPVVFGDPTPPSTPSSSSPSAPSSSVPTNSPSQSTSSSPSISLIPPTSRSLEPGVGLQLDLDDIEAGTPVTITVGGFEPYERVRIELHSTPVVLGYLQVDGRGAGTTVVTIPRDTAPGLHQIWVIGERSDIQFSKTVTITPASVELSQIVVEPTRRAAPDAKLSATGATVSPALAGTAGGLLLLAGLGLVAWSRHRTVAAH